VLPCPHFSFFLSFLFILGGGTMTREARETPEVPLFASLFSSSFSSPVLSSLAFLLSHLDCEAVAR